LANYDEKQKFIHMKNLKLTSINAGLLSNLEMSQV